MSGVWIGQARSIGLWTNINQYVETYVNIHQTAVDEPWYQTWSNLITEDRILTKERHFQFIAYRITHNPDATVEDCINKLFELIPRLSEHINIIDTNDRGNIQYTYVPYIPMSQTDVPEKDIPTVNPYSILQDDASTSQENDKLDDILRSDTDQEKSDASPIISPPKSSDTTPIRQFKATFTKVSDAIDDLSTPKISEINTNEFIRDIKTIYKHMLTAFDSTCKQIVQKYDVLYDTNHKQDTEISLKQYHETLEELTNSQIDNFETKLQHTLSQYDTKINDLNKRLNILTDRINNVNLRKSPVPQTPRSKQSPYTPQKSIHTTKESNTPSIQQYFHQHSLKFEHQGDEYYLQD